MFGYTFQQNKTKNNWSKTFCIVLLFSRRNSFTRSSLRRVDCWDTANWITTEKKNKLYKLASFRLVPLPPVYRTPTVSSTLALSSSSSSSLFYPPTPSWPPSHAIIPPITTTSTTYTQTHTHTVTSFPAEPSPPSPPLSHLCWRKPWLFILEGYLHCKHHHLEQGSDTSVFETSFPNKSPHSNLLSLI